MGSVFTCPDCDATVRLRQNVAAGKKIRCPKCESVIVVPEDEDEDEDRRTAIKTAASGPRRSRDADVDEDDLPRRKSRRREDDEDEEEERPRKKKKKKSGGVPVLVWVLLGVLLLAGGGVGIYFAVSSGKDKEKDKDKVTAKGDDKKEKADDEGKLTVDNFNKVKLGMTEEEVIRLLGPTSMPPQELRPGGQSRRLVWSDTNSNPPGQVALQFDNGKLQSGTGTLNNQIVQAGVTVVARPGPDTGTGTGSKVTNDNFKKLEEANFAQKLKTRAHAEAIMGPPTASLGKVKFGNETSVETLQWKDGRKEILVHFMSNYVIVQKKNF